MVKILLIDDENNLRMMIRLALQQKKYEVETAVDGTEGLEKFSNGSGWDLVLLDYRMPGMNGLEVLREMRHRKPDARIIMITAFGTVDLFQDAMRAGAHDFLRKPFTVDMLRDAVQAALVRRDAAANAHTTPHVEIDEVLEIGQLRFNSTTLNGFRIQYRPGSALKAQGETLYTFIVDSPDGQTQPCAVLLPAYVPELVKAFAIRENLPGNDRFWEAMCEEVLANYIWRHAELPTDGIIRIEELNDEIRRWVSAVIGASP